MVENNNDPSKPTIENDQDTYTGKYVEEHVKAIKEYNERRKREIDQEIEEFKNRRCYPKITEMKTNTNVHALGAILDNLQYDSIIFFFNTESFIRISRYRSGITVNYSFPDNDRIEVTLSEALQDDPPHYLYSINPKDLTILNETKIEFNQITKELLIYIDKFKSKKYVFESIFSSMIMV